MGCGGGRGWPLPRRGGVCDGEHHGGAEERHKRQLVDLEWCSSNQMRCALEAQDAAEGHPFAFELPLNCPISEYPSTGAHTYAMYSPPSAFTLALVPTVNTDVVGL